MFSAPNKYRVRSGFFATQDADGNNGLFIIPDVSSRLDLRVICGEGEGWQHVSVSLAARCPTWDEMCRVKNVFWGEEDCVMQLHPPKSDYVNLHPFVLHLWAPLDGVNIPRPPSWMVGPRPTT